MGRKIFIFYLYLNMDIALIMALSFLKTCIHVAEFYLEGRVSQNFDICLVCDIWYVEDGILTKNDKKY